MLALIRAHFVVGKGDFNVHTVRIQHVPKQCVRLLYTHNHYILKKMTWARILGKCRTLLYGFLT